MKEEPNKPRSRKKKPTSKKIKEVARFLAKIVLTKIIEIGLDMLLKYIKNIL